MYTIKKLFFLLSRKEKKLAVLLLICVIIMAVLDMIGIASILPFITIILDPTQVETNTFLNTIYKFSSLYGVKTYQEFIFVLGVFIFTLLIFSSIFKTFTTYFQNNFVYMREHSVGKRLVEGYLHQNYSWFLHRHSTNIGKIILSEVGQVIANGIAPLIELISKSIVAFAIITLLFLINPKLAFYITSILTAVYVSIFYIARYFLNQEGKRRFKSNHLRFKTVSEAFSAIKEIKIGGLEKNYFDKFSNSSQIFARSQTLQIVISQIPRLILETIAFGGILLILFYMSRSTGNFNSALPVIGLYVFASYRLMPALQQIYSCFTALTFVGPALNKVYEDLRSQKKFNKNQDKVNLSFYKKIELKNIYYNYPKKSKSTLKNINLSIPAKSTVGLTGTTGSGKTTVVDIILGLLEPQKGSLKVDGKLITKRNVRSWQRSIGYVPQNIYLRDDTIAANIAFGEELKDINQNTVEKVAKIANLHEFVINELPQKYQTIIGEQGVRLSGGQRQRIGIARALYHSPQLLILDEATNALDNKTEQAVIDAINNSFKDKTVILITHRLNTMKNCNIIFKLEKGEIIKQGTFKEVMQTKYK
jgi:ABC-type dipeptide/oligopeptide/nickel transport system ATPase component